MKIADKLDTSKLPDSFKKQICDQFNNLRECIIELKKENEQLKKLLKK